MKRLLIAIVRLRNPSFTLAREVDTSTVLAFGFTTVLTLVRGFRMLIHGKLPRGVLLGKGVQLRYVHKIQFGKFLKLGRFVTLQALGRGGILLGDNVSIGDYGKLVISTTLSDPGSHIRIGNCVGIGEHAYLGGAGGLTIGEECIIGQYFSCHPENHEFTDPDVAIRQQGVSRKGIDIGRNCWIGAKVTVLDGVSVGAHSVVAAGAVVTRSFPPYSIIGGCPRN